MENKAAENKFEKMAIEAIKKIDEPASYQVEYRNEDIDVLFTLLVPLNREQVAEVKNILAECNANGITLEEYFEEHSAPEYLVSDELDFYQTPITIDVEKAFHRCEVKIAMFRDGLEKEPKVFSSEIMLVEDDYASLLEWQLRNRKSSYNDLYNDKPELYNVINEAICDIISIDFLLPYALPPFAVEPTSIKLMAYDLCGEPAFSADIFAPDGGFMEYSHLHIENKVLSFYYKRHVKNSDNVCVLEEYALVDDVDVIAVQNALGVSNCHDVYLAVKERFGDKDGVDNFEQFLMDNGIEYSS